MRNIIVTAAVMGAAMVGTASCETYSLEAYYPSPVGVYRNLTVTSTTVLARDGGGARVGTAARPAKLEVTGPVNSGGVVIPGRLASDPVDPEQMVEGAIYFNTATKKHRTYSSGAWKDVGSGSVIFDSGLVTHAGGRSFRTFFLPAGIWKVNIMTGLEDGEFNNYSLTIDGTVVYTSPGMRADPQGTNWIPLAGSKDNVAGNRNIVCSFNKVPLWGQVGLMTMIAISK